MTDQEKGKLIDAIIGELKSAAALANKPFDGVDLFFKLAFMSDKNLKKTAKACGLQTP